MMEDSKKNGIIENEEQNVFERIIEPIIPLLENSKNKRKFKLFSESVCITIAM